MSAEGKVAAKEILQNVEAVQVMSRGMKHHGLVTRHEDVRCG